MKSSIYAVLLNRKQESFWTWNISISLLMEQNSRLIPTLMVRRYANANLASVNARDSTTLKMLLWVMILTEIATSLVTTFTNSTVGVLTTKQNYLPIWWWSLVSDTIQYQECMPAKEPPNLWDITLTTVALMVLMMPLISTSWLVTYGIWNHLYHSIQPTKVTLRTCLCLAWLKMAFLFVKLDTKCTTVVTAKTETDSSGDALSKHARRTKLLLVAILIPALRLTMVESFTLTLKIIHVYITLLPGEHRNGKIYMATGRQQREYSSERRTTLTFVRLRLEVRNVFFFMLYWQPLLFTLILGIVRITQRIVQSHLNVISSLWNQVFSDKRSKSLVTLSFCHLSLILFIISLWTIKFHSSCYFLVFPSPTFWDHSV